MKKPTILIKNGHVIDPKNNIDDVMDVLIKDGKIAEVGKSITTEAEQTVDAKGLIVTPGFVDIHVHFREPGREDKETIETGLRAALAGGVTSVVTMPNTTPITDSQSMVEFQIKRARELDLANLYPAGAITKEEAGEEISHIWEMKNSGIVALSDDGTDIQDEGLMKRSLEYGKTFDLVTINHCEIKDLSEDGVMHEGKISTKLGLPGIPEVAEELAVAKVLMLAEHVGTRVHISHVSTKRSVELIKEYQKRGVKITADTCPQYISLTDEACLDYNTFAKMYPPLRPQTGVDAVIEGIQEGIISVFATDHAPHTAFEKLQSFKDAQRGTVGLETSFAVANTFLVKTKKLPLKKLIEIMTVNPSNVISVNKGTLSIGADADVTILDPNKEWTADIEKMETKGRNSVFNGMTLTGKVQQVFVGGIQKVRDEKVI